MAFYAEELIFGGTSSRRFGLSIYDFDSVRQETNGFQETRDAVEEQLMRKYRTVYYGSSQNKQLELTFVLGLCQDRVDDGHPLERHEIEAVSQWLTSYDGYQYLEIVQPDMREYRYRARVSAIELVEQYWDDWAYKITFTCDGPFAYRYPETFTYEVSGSCEEQLLSRSTYGGVYYPQIKIEMTNSQNRTVEITNLSASGAKAMKFENVPTAVSTIYVDTDTKVIYTDSGDNIYPYFNFQYTGLVPGENQLSINGDCTVEFLCEFPVSIGG